MDKQPPAGAGVDFPNVRAVALTDGREHEPGKLVAVNAAAPERRER
jgi:hypothetical protein